jgi:hypothetical protein
MSNQAPKSTCSIDSQKKGAICPVCPMSLMIFLFQKSPALFVMVLAVMAGAGAWWLFGR